MSVFKEHSLYVRTASFTVLVSFITQIVSFISPYWLFTQTDGHYGLWLKCGGSCSGLVSPAGVLKSARILEAMSTAIGVLTLSMVFIMAFSIKPIHRTKSRRLAMVILSFFSAVLMQISIAVVIRSNYTDQNGHLSWALAVNFISVVFYTATGILMLIDILHSIFYVEKPNPNQTVKI